MSYTCDKCGSVVSCWGNRRPIISAPKSAAQEENDSLRQQLKACQEELEAAVIARNSFQRLGKKKQLTIKKATELLRSWVDEFDDEYKYLSVSSESKTFLSDMEVKDEI